ADRAARTDARRPPGGGPGRRPAASRDEVPGRGGRGGLPQAPPLADRVEGEGDREARDADRPARAPGAHECLRAQDRARRPDGDAYDLGSGAGLPGIPVAIARPYLRITLVDAQRRRVAWLEMVVEELGLTNAVARQARVEDLRDPVDVCLARAFAPLERSWPL